MNNKNMNPEYVVRIISGPFDTRDEALDYEDNVPSSLWSVLKAGEQIKTTKGLIDKKWYVVHAKNQA